jgi:hypothetical protein
LKTSGIDETGLRTLSPGRQTADRSSRKDRKMLHEQATSGVQCGVSGVIAFEESPYFEIQSLQRGYLAVAFSRWPPNA